MNEIAQIDPSSTLEILTKVDEFYNSAWTRLMAFSAFFVTVVSVILPLLISWINQKNQQKIFDTKSQEILDKITFETSKSRAEIETQLENSLELMVQEKTLKLEELIEERSSRAIGGIYQVQANVLHGKHDHREALISCLGAIKNHMLSNDEFNLQKMLDLSLISLETLSKKDFEEPDGLSRKIEDVISKLKRYNTNGRYSSNIQDLESAFIKSKRQDTENKQLATSKS